MTGTAAQPLTTQRAAMAAWTGALHEALTALFVGLDGQPFEESVWAREGGGGGQARLLVDGSVFEKAGVNRALVDGVLPVDAAARIGAALPDGRAPHFFATGVSVVAHPRSPMIPTLHLNVRYVEITDADGTPRDAWFGGGTDLTPMHPIPEDARHFHRTLQAVCDRRHPALYPRYKAECDEYFRNAHRGCEARGVGGIFFDHLRPAEPPAGLDAEALPGFVDAVGRSLADAYAPIVQRRRHLAYTPADRDLQLARRGRYVEFNLLHDRGTVFGLQTGARTDSVLMSLPPLASWPAPRDPAAGSVEAELVAMLVPRDWATED